MATYEDAERRSAIRTVEALQRGELPHNPELEHILDRAAATLAEQQLSGGLTAEGQQIARDAQDLVAALKVTIAEKNQDELIQRLHVHAKEATRATANVSEAIQTYDTQHGNTRPRARDAASNVATLVRSILTDVELRHLIFDFATLIKDTLYNMPVNAPISEHYDASFANTPSSNAPRTGPIQVTTTTTTTTSTGQPTKGSGYVPSSPRPMGAETYSVSTKTAEPTTTSPTESSFTNWASRVYESEAPVITTFTPREARVEPTTAEVNDMFAQTNLGPSERFTSESAPPPPPQSGIDPLFLARAIPPERQALLRHRFAELMKALHKNPDRVTAIRHLAEMSYSAGQRASYIHRDPAVTQHREEVMRESQRLIEAFAMNKSLDPLIQGWRSLLNQFRTNADTQNYLNGIYEFFSRSLDDYHFVASDSYENELAQALSGGRAQLYQYRPILYELSQGLEDFLRCIRRDSTSSMLADATQRLSSDIFMRDDASGRTFLRPGVIPELRKLFVALIAGQLTYVAIPCLTGSTDSMDYEIDNVVLRGVDIIPERVYFENKNVMNVETNLSSSHVTGHMHAHPSPGALKSTMYVRVEDVRASLFDVQFWYARKSFPRVTDRGKLDLHVTGKGIRLEIWLSTDLEHFEHVLRPVRCVAHVPRIRVKNMAGEQHRTMYKIFKPIIQGMLRRSLAQAIEENVNKLIVMLDGQLVNLAQHARTKIPSKLGVSQASSPSTTGTERFTSTRATIPHIESDTPIYRSM